MRKSSPASKILWSAIVIVAAFCPGLVALRRGDPINAIWLVATSISIFAISYRFYGKFVEHSMLQMDPTRAPPSVLHNDGLDYVPTAKWVAFGHHFAAIAGASPLAGLVLAAQMATCPAPGGSCSAWCLPVRCRTP